MRLNASSPIPLYRQLADRLLAAIDAGTYAVNTKIPSEHDLAQSFSIGRPTVRQATDLLVRRGRLERRRGSGTFVKPSSPTIDVLSLAGTSAAFQNSEFSADIELIEGAVLGADNCYTVQRRVLVEGEPVLLETLRFDGDVFTQLDTQNLENRSLSTLVKEVYFLEPLSADQRFSVTLANASISKALNVTRNTPLLHVHRSLNFPNQPNALSADIVCRTDRFDFSQTLHPTQPA